MQPFKESWVGKSLYATGRTIKKVPKSLYATGRTIKKVPSGVWGGLSIAAAGAGAGYYSLVSRTSLGETLAEAVTPLDFLHAVGGATAAYVGWKAKNLVDLAVPVAILGADNLFRKITESGYTFEQLGSDMKPEVLGAGALYLLGLSIGKLTSKKKTP